MEFTLCNFFGILVMEIDVCNPRLFNFLPWKTVLNPHSEINFQFVLDIPWLGRRKNLCGTLVLSGACLLCMLLVPNGTQFSYSLVFL